MAAFILLSIPSYWLLQVRTTEAQDSSAQRTATDNHGFYYEARAEPVRLEEHDIRDHLRTLFSWGGSQNYYFCFIMLPKQKDIQGLANVNFDSMVVGERKRDRKGWKINPYWTSEKAAPADQFATSPIGAITVRVPGDFERLGKKGICVVLDGLGTNVPIPAAEIFASYFAHGLVTRLVLGEYVKAWKNQGANLSLARLDFAKGTRPTRDIDVSSAYEEWSNYVDREKDVFDVDKGLSRLLIEENLQAAGILWGWKAAGELDELKGNDRKAWKAAWRLVKSRFSAEQMGELTAYTLNYLIGYVKVATLRAKLASAANAEPINKNFVRDLPTILTNLSQEANVKEAKDLLTLMHDAFLLEFHALTIDNRLSDDRKKKLLGWSFAFIRGFQAGSVKAFDDVFNDVFHEGYRVGYQDGFRDGYAKGYADGYRDGYAVGYKDAWAEANVIINQLKAELEQEQSGGLLGFLGKALGVAGSVVGIIAAL
jgi:hypothetical protein